MKYRMLNIIIKSKAASFNRKLLNRLNELNDNWEKKEELVASDLNIIRNNIVFHNLHKNKRAFIIASGPSLKNQDLSLLKNEITFVMNGFQKHNILEVWQPNYYCVIDPEYFKDNLNAYDNFKEINKKITTAKFILPLARGYGYNEKHKQLPNDRTYYCATYGIPTNYTIDLTKRIPGFQTVAAFAIANAIYMGCNPIYLIGFDHDYLAHKGVYRHFYERDDTLRGKKAEALNNLPFEEVYSYYETMKFMMKFWDNYLYLKKVALKQNIKIFNATEGGYLDVFPRTNYYSIFK